MIVVSDTSPITSLLQIGRASLLNELFDAVVIPQAVQEELVRTHETMPAFIQVHRAKNTTAVSSLRRSLDMGEAEAIVLAEELNAELLIMDETLGRGVAQARGLPVAGLLGVLVLAKRKGFVEKVRPIINELQTTAGFHVSTEVVAIVLAQANEAIG